MGANIILGLNENEAGAQIEDKIEGILKANTSLDIGAVLCVYDKQQFDKAVESGNYSIGIILEKMGEIAVGQGAIKSWKKNNPNMRILLIMSDDKKESLKPGGLYDRGYFNGVFESDFCTDKMFGLLERDRTDEEAYFYYGLDKVALTNSKQEKTSDSGEDKASSMELSGENISSISEPAPEPAKVASEEAQKDEALEKIDKIEMPEPVSVELGEGTYRKPRVSEDEELSTEEQEQLKKDVLVNNTEKSEESIDSYFNNEDYLKNYLEMAAEELKDDNVVGEGTDEISKEATLIFDQHFFSIYNFTKEATLNEALRKGMFDSLIDEAEVKLRQLKEFTDAGKALCLQKFIDFVSGYDILEKLLQIDDVTSIHVSDYDKIRVKMAGKRKTVALEFNSRQHYLRVINNIQTRLRQSGIEKGAFKTYTDDGRSKFLLQVQVIDGSTTSNEMPELIIKKQSKFKMSIEDMIGEKLTYQSAACIINRIKKGDGILLCGPTECGSTTLLNAMLEYIPRNKSGIVIQHKDELTVNSHPELSLRHPVSELKDETDKVKRKARSAEELAQDALGMDADYYIIADVQGNEAFSLYSALNSGFIPWASIKASTIEEALNRLVNLILAAEPSLDREAVSKMIASKFTMIIFMKKLVVAEIGEVNMESYDATTKRFTIKKLI